MPTTSNVNLGDIAADVSVLVRKIGSAAMDIALVAADLGEHAPVVGVLLKALKAVHTTVETVQSNREELAELAQRCSYLTANALVRWQRSSSGVDANPLRKCLEDVKELVERCGQRGMVMTVFMANRDKKAIAKLHRCVEDLRGDISLALLTCIEKQLAHQPGVQAPEPKGVPRRQHWHVDREGILNKVYEWLGNEEGLGPVGLVGESGSGKTTAASCIIRSTRMRQLFPDGILWLPVNKGAKDRLAALMSTLAGMVYRDIEERVGDRPPESGDSAAYIARCMENGHGGQGFQCLVVADNVWEPEVVSKLQKTGMRMLVTTRDEMLVTSAQGEYVRVDAMSDSDAELVLRRAAGLVDDERLPDAAIEVIEICDRVAMDVAFVGRWSMVRGQTGGKRWSDALASIHAALEDVERNRPGIYNRRRHAILRAGLKHLGVVEDNGEVRVLYVSLGVMPDGHLFTVGDATALLYDQECSTEDEAVVEELIRALERWTIVTSVDGNRYRVHDAHMAFARESLTGNGEVRRCVVRRWTKHISSLTFLHSMIDSSFWDGFQEPVGVWRLGMMWEALEIVGGDSWAEKRPYEEEVALMDDSAPLCRKYVEAVGLFYERRNDASALKQRRRLLELEQKDLGEDHPYVVKALNRLAKCAFDIGRHVEAEQWRQLHQRTFTLAMAKAKSELGAWRDDVDAVTCLGFHAGALNGLIVDQNEEEMLWRRALHVYENKLGKDDQKTQSTRRELAVCLVRAGRMEELEILCRRNVEASGDNQANDIDVLVAIELRSVAGYIGLINQQKGNSLLRRDLEMQKAMLGMDDLGVAQTLHDLGERLSGSGQQDQAEILLTRALDIRKDKLGEDDQQTQSTIRVLAMCLALAGRLEESEATLGRSEVKGGGTPGVDDDVLMTTESSFVKRPFLRSRKQLKQQHEVLLRRALDMLEAKLEKDDLEVAQTLHDLGVFLELKPRLDEAEALLRRALGICETKLGHDHRQTQSARRNLIECLARAGWMKEAEALLRCNMVSIANSSGTGNDSLVAIELRSVARNVGVVSLEREETLLRRALELQEVNLGENELEVAHTLCDLSACLSRSWHKNDVTEALLMRALKIRDNKLGGDHRLTRTTRRQLAEFLARTGQLKNVEALLRRNAERTENRLGTETDAFMAIELRSLAGHVGFTVELTHEALLRRALEIQEAKLGKTDLQVAHTLCDLGKYLSGRNQHEKARELLRRALDIRQNKLGGGHGQTHSARCKLAECLARAGKLEETEALFRNNVESIGNMRGAENDAVVAIELRSLAGHVVLMMGLTEALLRRALEMLVAKLGNDDLEVAHTLHDLGTCLIRSCCKDDEAGALLWRALNIRKDKLGGDHWLTQYTRRELVGCLVRAGRIKEAETLLWCHVESSGNKPGTEDDILMAVELRLVARSSGLQKEALLRHVLKMLEAKLGKDHIEVAYTLHDLDLYQSWIVQQNDGLEALLRRALDIYENTLGEDHWQTRFARRKHAERLARLGRPKETEALIRRNIKSIGNMSSTENDALVAIGLRSIARHFGLANEHREALLRRALEIQEFKLENNDFELAHTLNDLYASLPWNKKYEEEAGTLLRRVMHIREDRLGRSDWKTQFARRELAKWLAYVGRLEETESLLRRDVESKGGSTPEKEKDALLAIELRSMAGHCGFGHGSKKEAFLRRALAIQEAKLGKDNLEMAHTLYDLVLCLSSEGGREDEEEALLRRVLKIRENKLGDGHHQTQAARCELAKRFARTGRLEETEVLLRHNMENNKNTSETKNDVMVAIELRSMTKMAGVLGLTQNVTEAFLRRALEMQESKLGKEDLELAHTLHDLGVCLGLRQQMDEAEALLRRALNIHEDKLGDGHWQTKCTRRKLAERLACVGQLEETEAFLRRNMENKKASETENDALVAIELRSMTKMEGGLGLPQNIREAFLRRALEMQESKLGKEDLEVAHTLHDLGVCLGLRRQMDEPGTLLRRALDIHKDKLGDDHWQTKCTRRNLAERLACVGRLEETEALLRRNIENNEKRSEMENDALVVIELRSMARHLDRTGEHKEALLRHTLAIQEAKLGKDDLEMAHTLHDLGVCLCKRGRDEEKAGALLRRVLDIHQGIMKEGDLEVANSLHWLGVVSLRAGEPKEAEKMLRRALEIREAQIGEYDVWVSNTLYQLGLCLRIAGRLEEAAEALRRTLEIEEVTSRTNSLLVASVLWQLGVVLGKTERQEEAVDLLTRGLSILDENELGEGQGCLMTQILCELAIRSDARGRKGRADEYIGRALGIMKDKKCTDTDEAVLALFGLGVYAWRAGWTDKARELLTRATGVDDKSGGGIDGERVAGKLQRLGVRVGSVWSPGENEKLLRCILGTE